MKQTIVAEECCRCSHQHPVVGEKEFVNCVECGHVFCERCSLIESRTEPPITKPRPRPPRAR